MTTDHAHAIAVWDAPPTSRTRRPLPVPGARLPWVPSPMSLSEASVHNLRCAQTGGRSYACGRDVTAKTTLDDARSMGRVPQGGGGA